LKQSETPFGVSDTFPAQTGIRKNNIFRKKFKEGEIMNNEQSENKINGRF